MRAASLARRFGSFGWLPRARRGGGAGHDLLVPANRIRQPLTKWRRRAEPELLFGAIDVELAPRLTVRLGFIPDDLALEAGQLRDQLRQVFDRDLGRTSNVDRVGFVVALSGEDDRPRRVSNIKELAGWSSRSPNLYRSRACLACFQALADERRDHM